MAGAIPDPSAYPKDAVIVPLPTPSAHNVAVCDRLRASGWNVLDTVSPRSLWVTDKCEFGPALTEAGLPAVPTTRVPFDDILAPDTRFPVVLKACRGAAGQFVRVAHDMDGARVAIRELRQADRGDVIVQPFVTRTSGPPIDIRVHVIDGAVRGLLSRHAQQGQWCTDPSAGAVCRPYDGPLAATATTIALDAAALAGLRRVAVDFLVVDDQGYDDGLVICEVNTPPGVAGTVAALGLSWLVDVLNTLVGRRNA